LLFPVLRHGGKLQNKTSDINSLHNNLIIQCAMRRVSYAAFFRRRVTAPQLARCAVAGILFRSKSAPMSRNEIPPKRGIAAGPLPGLSVFTQLKMKNVKITSIAHRVARAAVAI